MELLKAILDLSLRFHEFSGAIEILVGIIFDLNEIVNYAV